MSPVTLLSPAFLTSLDRLVLVSRRLRAGTYKGERRSPRRGGSVEFADYREYAPGDDLRQLDWNAYARLERLFLRLFVEEQDATVHILLDASASMNWGEPAKGTTRAKFLYAQKLAAALGYIVLVGMDRLAASALGARPRDLITLAPLRTKANALTWFRWLEHLETGAMLSPQPALERYAAEMRRAGPLILISDLMNDGWREGIRRLSERGYEITLLHLLAPEELDPALEGDLKLLDSEGASAVEITADYDLLERYRARVQEWQSEWARWCAARDLRYVPLSTAQPLEELVLSFLRKREVLA